MVKVSDDAYRGRGQQTVSVDGQQFGSVRTAAVDHKSSQAPPLILNGGWDDGAYDVVVAFVNDLYVVRQRQRDLYVGGISFK